jgi:hypothetical protein
MNTASPKEDGAKADMLAHSASNMTLTAPTEPAPKAIKEDKHKINLVSTDTYQLPLTHTRLLKNTALSIFFQRGDFRESSMQTITHQSF